MKVILFMTGRGLHETALHHTWPDPGCTKEAAKSGTDFIHEPHLGNKHICSWVLQTFRICWRGSVQHLRQTCYKKNATMRRGHWGFTPSLLLRPRASPQGGAGLILQPAASPWHLAASVWVTKMATVVSIWLWGEKPVNTLRQKVFFCPTRLAWHTSVHTCVFAWQGVAASIPEQDRVLILKQN